MSGGTLAYAPKHRSSYAIFLIPDALPPPHPEVSWGTGSPKTFSLVLSLWEPHTAQ